MRMSSAPSPITIVNRSPRSMNPSRSATAGVKTLMKLRLVTLQVFSSEK